MKVACHQPYYLPWAGYFHKMSAADTFVVLDDVQFVRREHFNRAAVLEGGAERWLTVPVPSGVGDRMSEVRVSDRRWVEKHSRTLRQAYARAPYGNLIGDFVDEIYKGHLATWRNPMKLAEIDMYLIEVLHRRLSIHASIMFSSMVDYEPAMKSVRIMNICKALRADTYVAGSGASKRYLNADAFRVAGIRIEWQSFDYEPYPQPGVAGFVPGLSVLDTVAALGWDGAAEYIRRCGRTA